MATVSDPSSSSSSSSATWNDPYKEFELYLEKANVSCFSFVFFAFLSLLCCCSNRTRRWRRQVWWMPILKRTAPFSGWPAFLFNRERKRRNVKTMRYTENREPLTSHSRLEDRLRMSRQYPHRDRADAYRWINVYKTHNQYETTSLGWKI